MKPTPYNPHAQPLTAGDTRWVLAFDSSCSTCRAISDSVGQACDGKLEVLPLGRVDVRRWRERGFDGDAPWTPTLLRVRGDDDVRVWTGVGMAAPLGQRLGPRTTLRVLRSLGRMRQGQTAPVSASSAAGEPAGRCFSRARFIQLGAGTLVAGGLLSPAASSAADGRAEAEAWVAARRGRLPQSYDEVVSLRMARRQAVYRASSPEVRSGLWVEQLRRYRDAHPGMTDQQRAALESAMTVAGDVAVFSSDPGTLSATHARLEALRDEVARAFGARDGRALVEILGPADVSREASARDATLAAAACSCSTASDWCQTECVGHAICPCSPADGGCGTFGWYDCDGECQDCPSAG